VTARVHRVGAERHTVLIGPRHTGTPLAYCIAYEFVAYVMRCLHDPANFQHYICWKFAGRLLTRVNTILLSGDLADMVTTQHTAPTKVACL